MIEPTEIFFEETNLSAKRLTRLANYFSWFYGKEESLVFISIKERTYALGGTYQINVEGSADPEIRITIPLS